MELTHKNNHIHLRGLDLHALANEMKTPLFIYDVDCIKERIKCLKQHLCDGIKIYFAMKANPNLEILKIIRPLVDGLDISSGGEFTRALKTGYDPQTLSFAGPGKTDEELEFVISHGLGIISVESINELKRANLIAAKIDKTANICIRINPSKYHKKFAVKMGGRPSQFGIDEEDYLKFFNCLKTMECCSFKGIHIYTGTQCLDEETLIDNVVNILSLAKKIHHATGVIPKYINFGGGFGVPYHGLQQAFDLDYVCSEISKHFEVYKRDTGFSETVGIFELGRFIIAEAGLYVTTVVDKKISRGKHFCVLDGGMNHHLPASGNFGQVVRKNYKFVNLSNVEDEQKETTSFVGPICTIIDIMAEKIEINTIEIGDFIAILNSGAYGLSVSPLFFLSHETPIELLVEGNSVRKIRQSFSSEILD